MKKLIHIISADYIKGYTIRITFSDGHVSIVNFKDAFDYYCKGYYEKYKKPSLFKRFKIDEGKLVWGKDWDVIFDEHSLYKGHIFVPGESLARKRRLDKNDKSKIKTI